MNADRNQKLSAKLFGDPINAWLDEQTRVACNHRGIVNAPEVAAAQAAERQKWAPLRAENPNMSEAAFKEVVVASQRPAATEEVAQARGRMFLEMRTPLAETAKERQADGRALDAEHQAKPLLGDLIRKTGLGQSLWFGHVTLRDKREASGK